MEQLQGKTRKRAGSTLQPPSKRSKPAARPAWISQQTATAVRREYGGGERGGRGRGGRAAEAASEDSEAAEAADPTEKIVALFFSYHKKIYKKP
jgi:hypothetical protein